MATRQSASLGQEESIPTEGNPPVNYFVCTLGQAKHLARFQQIPSNVNEFVDQLAHDSPNSPAIGFVQPGSSLTTYFTFQDIQRGSCYVARKTNNDLSIAKTEMRTIALLCPNIPEFVFIWLALIRLGCGVLLIAPQCQPPEVAHLCKVCDVKALLFDDLYEDQASQISAYIQDHADPKFICKSLPFSVTGQAFQDALRLPCTAVKPAFPISSETVAYLHHTSGTSSGLPKPIPQSHHAAVGVLPGLENGQRSATFTTTALYHGGIADLFRAWSASALIWIFSDKDRLEMRKCAITAKNVESCLQKTYTNTSLPQVKYFSCVPYVLQMLFEYPDGITILKNMEIVGVGGAAMPRDIGDLLVSKGVNLISRFGSAECGFFMSSHRDYANDKEWQYLRPGSGADLICFEPRENGRYELVALPSWPHRAKINRLDGSYATSDLFVKHETTPGAWKYDSRADSQLTLLSGKKFDPAPLEDQIASSQLLDDAFVFGNGRMFPGVLLFRKESAEGLSDPEMISRIAPEIAKLNEKSQIHARIPRNMLIVMSHDDNKLQKSSKGTKLRNKAEATYSTVIEQAYDKFEVPKIEDTSEAAITELLLELVQNTTGTKPDPDADLFSHGVDSVASIQIRDIIKRALPQDAEQISFTVVEDCGTINRLAQHIYDLIHHDIRGEDVEGPFKLMQKLVDKYSNFTSFRTPANGIHKTLEFAVDNSTASEVIVLTGATGALGAFVLDFYRNDPCVSKIYCLVRGETPDAARERVDKSLSSRELPGLDVSVSGNSKIVVLQTQLSNPQLGLPTKDYIALTNTATAIIHLAWAVNFRLRLSSFEKDHLAGLNHLICFALSGSQPKPPIFAFCSSIASVSARQSSNFVAETISHEPKDASPIGYSQSKWVAEQICLRAAAQYPQLQKRMAIFRVGQVSGATGTGVWNMKEAWPTMLASVKLTGALPNLENEILQWTPVDVAAKAMIEGATALAELGKDGDATDVPIWHLVNPDRAVTWTKLLSWLKAKGDFDVLPPQEWVSKLDAMRMHDPEHACFRLLDHWRKTYGATEAIPSSEIEGNETGRDRIFDTAEAERNMPSLSALRTKGLDREYFERLWGWIMAQAKQSLD